MKYLTQIITGIISFVFITTIGTIVYSGKEKAIEAKESSLNNKTEIKVIAEKHSNLQVRLVEFIVEQKTVNNKVLNKLDNLNTYILKNIREDN